MFFQVKKIYELDVEGCIEMNQWGGSQVVTTAPDVRKTLNQGMEICTKNSVQWG